MFTSAQALHVAGLKCKKIVRLAPADAKIGLQQIAPRNTSRISCKPARQ